MPGITDAGFEIRSFGEIKTALENGFRTIFGDDINLSSTSLLGQQIGIFTNELFSTWQLGNGNYRSRYPHTAEGRALESVVSVAGLGRIQGFKTSGSVYLIGDENTVIPEGTVLETASGIQVQTQENATLILGQKGVLRFTKEPGNSATSFTITVSDSFFGRFNDILGNSVTASYTDTPANLVTEFETVFGTGKVESVTTDTNHVEMTFMDNDFTPGLSGLNTNISVRNEGLPDGLAVGCEALEDGPTVIARGAITVIGTPVAGFDAVLNVRDFVTGRLAETDLELRARWTQRVSSAQSASDEAIRAQLRNITGVSEANVNSSPGEIEAIVNGGSDEDIAQILFTAKPAGTQLLGSELVFVDDEDDNPVPIRFSRPVIRSLIVKIFYRSNDDFQDDGEERMRQSILDYQSSFRVGSPVRPSPDLIWSMRDIPGIDSLFITVGEALDSLSALTFTLNPQEIVSFSQIILEKQN